MKIKRNFKFLLLVLLLFIFNFCSIFIPIEIESNRDNGVVESIRIENINENFFEINENMNSQHQIYFSNKRTLKKINEYYLVLEYTRIFGNTKYCQMKINSNAFKNYKNLSLFTETNNEPNNEAFDLLENCRFKNCFFTCNKSFADSSDALIFHDTDSLNVSFKREQSQVFIFWNDEANYVSNDLDNLNFNWTISYRYESEVSFCSYGCYKSNNVKNKKQHLFETTILKEFNSRENNSIWFISNCNSRYRIELAINLGLNFPIKIYGKCRNEIESKLNQANKTNKIKFNDNKCERDSDCEIDENKFNKFSLSFENSNCSSYITEKFWRSLYYGIIPIVIQPAKIFYEQIAPKDSFIHAEDFDFDITKLTAYLNEVSKNFKLFLKHLQWKFDYDVFFEAKEVEQNRICELCTKLNTYDKMKHYKSVSNYFNNNCAKN
jgi:hypothetical protein